MATLNVLELFAGTRSIGKAFEARGHKVFSVDWDSTLEGIDLSADILSINHQDIIAAIGHPDVIRASPDCTTYSVAALSTHRQRFDDGFLLPKTEYARFCDRVNAHVINLILMLRPGLFFIGNPRGCLRKMPFTHGIPRYTVTYCQYGDTRQKPTDIFTNAKNPDFRPPCDRSAPCHVAAPRGSRTGTQGIKGAKHRSVIPAELCRHIVDICERELA